MSISNSYPTQTPLLNLNFATGSDQFLDSRISFSRADSTPSNVHYWSNEKHLSSENLVTQSDGSDWIISSADYTKTASQNGPDGSTNATKYTEKANGNTDYEIRSNSFTPIANKEITYSVWFKQTSGSRDYQQLRVGNIGANQAFATFNLTNGTVDQTGGTLGVSASVNAGPTGWYQCVMRFTPTTSTALSFYIYAAAASGGEFPQVTGDTGNSLTMFGAQASTTGETVVNETSGQIHREFAPTLKSVANAGDPRFEYDPADGQSVGLLIESSASNLQRYGSKFESWVGGTFAGVYADSAIAPNGQLEARLAVPPDAVGSKFLLDNTVSSTSGDTYTASVYAKSAGHRYVQLAFGSGAYGATKWATFDLETGSVDANGLTASAAESVGNGWYRLSITATATSSSASSAFVAFVGTATAARNAAHVGDDYSGVLLWGYQYEEGSSASSLVDTGSQNSALTRASDSCSVAVSQLGLTSSQDVTLLVEGDYGDPTASANTRFAVALGKDSQSYISLYNGNGESGSGYIRTNAPTEFYNASGVTSGNFKAAISAKNNSVKYAADGTSFAEDTDAELPEYTSLKIGGQFNGTAMNGTISRVALYGQALSSTELAALTS